jgi:hypothetical protein
MTGLESTKLPEPSVEPFWSPSGANARSAKSSNPKVHRIDPGNLTGRVFGGFGVKHERTTTDLRCWAAAARSAPSALVCVPRARHRKLLCVLGSPYRVAELDSGN